MKGFLLGLLVAALAFGAYLYSSGRRASHPDRAQVHGAADGGAPTRKKRRRARGAQRLAHGGAPVDRPAHAEPESDPEPEPVRLSPADLKIVGQGDDLSRPDVIRMDFADGKETRELTQEDIDTRFRAQEPAILDCIASARPDPDSYVPGRVTVKFRIQRTGTVRGVRVDAPAILQRGGIYGCVKKAVGGLRFPPSGSSQILTYPFTLS
jgi:hypothetical protein